MQARGVNPSRYGLEHHGIQNVNQSIHGALARRQVRRAGAVHPGPDLVGPVNRPFDSARFDALYGRLLAYLQGSDLYVQDCFAGADPDHRIPIRIITEYAWHNLFARQLFGLQVPTACPDVPALILSPRTTWPKAEAYDAQAERLAALFRKNFEQFGDVPAGVREAGPTAG
jgi:ATP-dependent phosphoenolpyruvate carboxykinase